MADERDFELLDDYLTNRLNEQDRTAFEQRLNADPDLRNEYALQKRLIQGIRDARVAELKSMLNQVPVPSTGNALGSKVVLGAVATLIIAVAAYWLLRHNQETVSDRRSGAAVEEQAPAPTESVPQIQPDIKQSEEQVVPKQEKQAADTDKNQTSAGTEHSKPSLARRPAPLPAPDPASKRVGPAPDTLTPESRDTQESNRENNTVVTPVPPAMIVETDRNNRRYTFHYQFREGKLFLFGPFERDLYELFEFVSDEKTSLVLYYQAQYYLLQKGRDTRVTPLTPVTDTALITKLTEFRHSR